MPLSDGRWVGACRTYLGSPGFTVSRDQGRSWSPVERLRYGPDGSTIDHPHTMCPIARLPDGRFILLFTNNDGTRNGAEHVWDGGCRTRNPQWFVIGVEIPDEDRNGGLLFGEPRILAEAVERQFVELSKLKPKELVAARAEKYRTMGTFEPDPTEARKLAEEEQDQEQD